MADAYTYLTRAQLRAALMERLQDTSASFTSTAEANLYLNEALRLLAAQTLQPGQTDYQFDFNPGDTWKSLNVAGSPRERTVTDTDLYNQMEAMLLEPMTGGTWTGTPQFDIALLSQALQYRRDELLLVSAANTVNAILPAPVLSVRTTLDDSTLDVLRVRWVPADTDYSPYALGREDVVSRNAFGVNLPLTPGEPESWMIIANSPLTFDASRPPDQPGQWDTLLVKAGLQFAPPNSTLVGIPDNWTPALLYGALADVLSNSPEGRDLLRAKYCLQRFQQFKKAILKMPWLLQATVASVPVDTPSCLEMDSYAQNWEQTWPADDPQIVVGGIDLVALGPFIPSNGATVSTVLTLAGNAPLPAGDDSFVQLDRAGVDAVLDYSQHVAMFKCGGEEFMATVPLLQQFESYCRAKNAQYAALGIFRVEMTEEGNRADSLDPRFEEVQQ